MNNLRGYTLAGTENPRVVKLLALPVTEARAALRSPLTFSAGGAGVAPTATSSANAGCSDKAGDSDNAACQLHHDENTQELHDARSAFPRG